MNLEEKVDVLKKLINEEHFDTDILKQAFNELKKNEIVFNSLNEYRFTECIKEEYKIKFKKKIVPDSFYRVEPKEYFKEEQMKRQSFLIKNQHSVCVVLILRFYS